VKVARIAYPLSQRVVARYSGGIPSKPHVILRAILVPVSQRSLPHAQNRDPASIKIQVITSILVHGIARLPVARIYTQSEVTLIQ
jgi:hypothetical protein